MAFDPATLLGPLLDSIGDDTAFADFARLLVQSTLSASTNIQIHSAAGARTQAAFGMSPDLLAPYAAHYWKLDLWANGYQAGPLGTLINGNEIVSDDEFRRSEIYNDCLKDNGDQFRVAGLVAQVDPGHRFVFGVHRTSRQDNFDDSTQAGLQALAPTLIQVVKSRLRLARSSMSIAASIAEDDADPILVVDSASALLYANRTATHMLALGIPFRQAGGRVAATGQDFSSQFRLALRWAARKGGQTINPSLDGARYRIEIDPMRNSDLLKIRVVDTQTILDRRISTARTRFGLSASETALLRALATGFKPVAIARNRGVSIATIRTQLRSLFEKAGADRQSDLLLKLIDLDQNPHQP